jgi:two-component system response regulator YesN
MEKRRGSNMLKFGRLQSIQQNKLFYKILLYFLVLLIPIVIIGLLTYHNVNQLIKEDVSKKLTENLKSSSETINTYLSMIQSTNNHLFLNDIVQQNLVPYDMQTDRERINMPAIVKEIASNQNTFYPFIQSIFLYIDDKKVYTGEAVYDFTMFFNKFNHFTEQSIEFWRGNLQRDSFFQLLQPDQVTNYNGNISVGVIPSMSTQYLNGSLATVVTTISIPAITNVLRSNSIYSSTSYLVIDPQQNVVLNSRGLTGDDITLIRTAFPSNPRDQVQQLHMGGMDSMVVHTSFNSFGWDFYSVTPLNAFNGEPASILNLILWICISLIVVGAILSLIFSMSLYNPIKNIREILLQNVQTQEVHSEARSPGEFQLIVSRIHQLFAHNKEVTLKMDRFSHELLEQFFTDAINGRQWLQQETVKEVLENISFHKGSYLSCCLLFRFNDRFYHDIAEADRMLIQEKLKHVIWGMLRNKVNGYLLELEQHLYVFVVNLQGEEDRSHFDLALEQVRLTFEYDMIYCDLLIGVGNVYDHIMEMNKSFSDALTAIDKRTAESASQILDAANMDIQQSYYYSFLDEIKVVNSLKSGDMDLLRENVEGLIQVNRSRGVSYQSLGKLLVMLFYTGYRYMNERHLNIQDFLTDAENANLTNTNLLPSDYNDRIQRLFRFYDGIVTETVVKMGRKSTTVVALITGYIEENYAEDIYLEKIAAEVGIHFADSNDEGQGNVGANGFENWRNCQPRRHF